MNADFGAGMYVAEAAVQMDVVVAAADLLLDVVVAVLIAVLSVWETASLIVQLALLAAETESENNVYITLMIMPQLFSFWYTVVANMNSGCQHSIPAFPFMYLTTCV